MKLLSLKLLNFRRFRKQEIFFKDDFSLIFWKNWAWKSSILDAIWFAIFWPSSKDFVRVNTTFLKSHFLKQREPSKIELNFSYWLKEFRVIRIIDNWIKKFWDDFIKETKDSLFTSDWIEIIWWVEITNYLTKLLWVSRDTFLRSVFAKQKDLEVLSWWKEERKKLINNILWLDKIEFFIWEIKKELKDKKNTLDYIKSDLDKINLTELKENIKIKDDEIKFLNNEFQNIRLKKEQYQKDYDKIKIIFEEKTKQKNDFLELNSQINLNKNKVLNIKKSIDEKTIALNEISKKEQLLEKNKKVIDWEKDLLTRLETYNIKKEKHIQKNQIKIEIENKNIQIIELNKYFENIKNTNYLKEIENLNKNIALEQEKILQYDQNISKIKIEMDNITISWKELKTELEQIQHLWEKADCPTCKRPLDNYFPKLIELFEKELAQKRENFKILNEKLNILQKEKTDLFNYSEKLKNQLDELKNKEKVFLVNTEKFNLFSKDLEVLKEKLEILKDINYDENEHNLIISQHNEAKQELQKYMILMWEISKKQEFTLYIEANKKDLIELENTLKTQLNNLEKLNFDEKFFIETKQNFDEIWKKVFEINSIFSEKDKEILNKNFEMTTLKNKLQEIELQKAKTWVLSNEIIYLETKINILDDYIIYLLNHLKPNIENIASQYFAIITDNKYWSISLDENYNILIDEKEVELYSWWEKDLANLCLRLSLWQNLSSTNWNPINFLILDEVLASQDKERQFNILINLKKLEKKFSQIILISHLDDIKDIATNIIEVKQKDLEESEVFCY